MVDNLKFCGDVWLPTGATLNMPSWCLDGLVVNLEGPITSRGSAASGKILLATDAEKFEKAFERPPLAACLANNHIMDFGETGFSDTISFFEKSGIKFFGAGSFEDSCNNPLVLRANGVKVGLMGYVCPTTHPIWATEKSSGVAPMDLNRIRTDMAVAQGKGAERFVVHLHWGCEQVGLPKPEDVEFSAQLMEMGVDLIIGHHAHCRQPIALVGKQAVCFGLGNALFSDFVCDSLGLAHPFTRRSWLGSKRRLAQSAHLYSRQRWWNLESTLIEFNPNSRQINWKGLHLRRGGACRSFPWFFPQKLWHSFPEAQLRSRYQRRYKRARRFGIGRSVLSSFIAEPKWPSAKRWRHFMGKLLKA